MTRGGRDDEVVRVARRYCVEEIACLVATIRSEDATARANGAARLLEYAKDKTEQQPVRVADLDALTGEEREELFEHLLERYQITPAAFEKTMRLCYRVAKLLHPLGKAEAERLVDLVMARPDALKQLRQLKRQQQRPRPQHRTATRKLAADEAPKRLRTR